MSTSERIYAPEHAALRGCSVATLWRLVSRGAVPPPIKASPRCHYWLRERVRDSLRAIGLPVD